MMFEGRGKLVTNKGKKFSGAFKNNKFRNKKIILEEESEDEEGFAYAPSKDSGEEESVEENISEDEEGLMMSEKPEVEFTVPDGLDIPIPVPLMREAPRENPVMSKGFEKLQE